jgi:hypothetical protein
MCCVPPTAGRPPIPASTTTWPRLEIGGRAEIQVGAEHLAVSARTADPTERGRLFPRFVQMYKGYGAYEDKTSRQIPLVLLTPDPPNSTAFAW